MVRFETYKAGAFLVWQLKHAGATILADGGDIIQARLPSQETISLHLIESPIPLYEIKNTLVYNEAAGHHTLFVLWCDMLLPPEDHVVTAHDWENALLALYGEQLYAYEVFGSETFIFPVHFEPEGRYYHIRYGETLYMRNLSATFVETGQYAVAGRWRVAHFTRHYQAHRKTGGAFAAAPNEDMGAYFALMGLSHEAELAAVKTAYRRMARKLHPDVNPSPNATAEMQGLNEAYQRILDQFEDD